MGPLQHLLQSSLIVQLLDELANNATRLNEREEFRHNLVVLFASPTELEQQATVKVVPHLTFENKTLSDPLLEINNLVGVQGIFGLCGRRNNLSLGLLRALLSLLKHR